jgi:hypothetical protein
MDVERRWPSWSIGDGLVFVIEIFFFHKREEEVVGGRGRRSVQIQKACLLLREARTF